ncbi:SnoaL-like domain-containing protein [Cladophialophora immunda]|nr:SnoaL-like domain-containing protein [Cladophialophora immunda]
MSRGGSPEWFPDVSPCHKPPPDPETAAAHIISPMSGLWNSAHQGMLLHPSLNGQKLNRDGPISSISTNPRKIKDVPRAVHEAPKQRSRMAVSADTFQAISRKKALYGRLVDTKRFDQFALVALPECSFDFLDTDGKPLARDGVVFTFSSRDAFTSHLGVFLAKVQSLHMFGPGDLRYLTPEEDEVEAIWSMEDQLIWREARPPFQMRGGGYYHETWALKNGEWLLKSLRLERTYTKVNKRSTRALVVNEIDPSFTDIPPKQVTALTELKL